MIEPRPITTPRAPHRLRDLSRRDRTILLGLLVVVLAPFVAAVVRALADGWVPTSDEANIAVRALDVFSRHPPLTGLPSTSGLYGSHVPSDHPGPFEFYLLAIPVRVLGGALGSVATAAAINAGCVLVALWVCFRRLGVTATVGAGVVVTAVVWSGGNLVLVDTLSSNMTMYSLLATAALAWALVDGDLRLLPLTAFVGSYAAQQHLAAGLIVAALAGLVIVAIVVRFVVARQADRASPLNRGAVAAATAIVGVCWLPVIIDEVKNHPGNLTAILRLARHGHVPSLGLKLGVYQAVHTLGPPTVLGRANTTGLFFTSPPSTALFVGAAVVALAVAAVAWHERASSPAIATLGLTGLVIIAAGIIDGSKVPASYEADRVNLYRWTWAAAFLAFTTLGVGLATIVARRNSGRTFVGRVATVGVPVLLAVALLTSTASAVAARPDTERLQVETFRVVKHLQSAVLASVDRTHPIVVVEAGDAATLVIGPALIFRLIREGLDVEVSDFESGAYGTARAYRPQPGTTAVVVISGKHSLPATIGRSLATDRFGPERSTLLDELARAAAGRPVELAAGAQARIDRQFSGIGLIAVRHLLAALSTNPRAVLAQPAIVSLFAAGDFRSPALDPTKVRRLSQLSPAANSISGDEDVGVRLAAPAELLTPAFARLLIPTTAH